jgi:predicted 3-demethylubiquinone-9 3-methyltransferase (glyoxalase superfamily)
MPSALLDMINDPDQAAAARAAAAMPQMKKFDIAALERAHSGD